MEDMVGLVGVGYDRTRKWGEEERRDTCTLVGEVGSGSRFALALVPDRAGKRGGRTDDSASSNANGR